MKLHHERPGVALWQGDAVDVAAHLAPGSVQTIVTSPPYFGLRDYGVPGELGSETDPLEYIANLVVLLGELRTVLADDGVLWLNLGDTYAPNWSSKRPACGGGFKADASRERVTRYPGFKPKTLMGIPWRVAIALVDDGWVLRSDVIWAKPNPMPESVRDRPTRSHEHIFMLTKSPRYYYNAAAVAEPAVEAGRYVKPYGEGTKHATQSDEQRDRTQRYAPSGGVLVGATRNRRDVWTVGTQPFPGAHFATYPPRLIEPCILSSSRPAGKRCDCDEVIATPTGSGEREPGPSMQVGRGGLSRPRGADEGVRVITRREQRGHAAQLKASPHRANIEAMAGPAFAHYIRTDRSGARPLPPALLADLEARGWLEPVAPCDHPEEPADLVLDPFSGSGTTGMVALEHGRRYVGIDLSTEYLDLSLSTRLKEG